MPKGIPVAAIAIGNAENAGLLAVRILASRDPELYDEYGSLLVLFFARRMCSSEWCQCNCL
jgi:hypothetical protein